MGQRAKKVETGVAVEPSSSLAKRNSGNKRHMNQSANPKLSENARSLQKDNLFIPENSNIAALTFSIQEVPLIQSSRVLRNREVLSVDTAGKKKRRKTATIDTDGRADRPVLARISSGVDHTACLNVTASLDDPASHVPDEMQKVGEVQDSLHEEFPQSGNTVVLNCEAVNVHKGSFIPDSQMGTFEEHHIGDQAEPLSPMTKLMKAYDKICRKYKRSKTRRLQEIEALFDDQKRRETAHSKATNVLVELLRKENLWLKHQIEETKIEDTVLRLKLLEHENAECRNDLVMVCAKNLELVEELKNLRSSILAQDADTVAKHENNTGNKSAPLSADVGGETAGDISESEGMVIAETKVASLSKEALNKIKMPVTEKKDCCLLQVILQSITKLQLLVDSSLEPSQLTFLHHPTGLQFKLEQTVDENIAQYCGGGGELRVEMISLGTLKPRAPQWMHDILTFSIKHVHLFFSRIHAAIDAISSSSSPGA